MSAKAVNTRIVRNANRTGKGLSAAIGTIFVKLPLALLHGTVYHVDMASGDRDERRGRKAGWDEARLRALRRHLGLTQQALATELGVRQQTVSEWETGVYRPRGASARLLGIVAERAGFGYEPASGPLTPENGGTTETSPNSRKHDGTAETSPDPRELDGPTKMVLNARTHDGSSGASPGLPDGGGR